MPLICLKVVDDDSAAGARRTTTGVFRASENVIGEQLHPRGADGSLPTMGSHSCRKAVIGSTRVARRAGR